MRSIVARRAGGRGRGDPPSVARVTEPRIRCRNGPLHLRVTLGWVHPGSGSSLCRSSGGNAVSLPWRRGAPEGRESSLRDQGDSPPVAMVSRRRALAVRLAFVRWGRARQRGLAPAEVPRALGARAPVDHTPRVVPRRGRGSAWVGTKGQPVIRHFRGKGQPRPRVAASVS